MVSRISAVFDELKSKTGLITYITAGFPTQNICHKIMNELSLSGSDILELGMPFSDPMADGPIIQKSSKISLENGHTMEKTFDLVKNFRENNDKTPLVLMGYYNPIYQYGNDKFLKRCDDYGVDGLIIVDLPPEHDNELCDLMINSNIDFIRLVTPTTNENRLKKVLNKGSGFLYYVSITGITGTKEPDLELLKKQIDNLKLSTEIPIAVGFGIKTSDQAKKISEFSDAIVIGSALIENIMESYKNNDEEGLVKEVRSYIERIKSAMK